MKRNHGISNRYPGYYNHELLNHYRLKAGLTVKDVSIKSGVKLDSTRRVFLGEAHQKQVWPIANYFKIDWSLLHDLSLQPNEFHRAEIRTSAR